MLLYISKSISFQDIPNIIYPAPQLALPAPPSNLLYETSMKHHIV